VSRVNERKITVTARVEPSLAEAVAALADVGNRPISREIAAKLSDSRPRSSGGLPRPLELVSSPANNEFRPGLRPSLPTAGVWPAAGAKRRAPAYQRFSRQVNSAASPVGLTLPKRNGGLRGQEPSNPCQVGRELLGSGGEPCLVPRGVITSGPAPEKRSSSVSANKFRHVTDDGRAVTAVVLGGAVRAQEISWTPCLYHLDRGPSGSRVSVVAAALKQGEERASSPEHNPGHVH
jgi:hypothetical protein